ncbi:MAG TPA: DNA-processing protein DprA [Chloroflexota bacterium]|nr:DNA-processing protein DprA [Chloroflexota bacterium]
MREDAGYWIAWSRITGIGAARVRRLWEHFGDLATAWEAPAEALLRAGIDRRVAAAAVSERPALNPRAERDALERAGVDLVTLADPTYPVLLRRGDGGPASLHVRGALVPEDEMAIAIVGSRLISSYGKQVTLQFVGDLARQGLTIVSGLARGIDAVAHRAALEGGARTIAVLGCGVDVVYPPEHRGLAADVAAHGAVVSEFPLGTKPDAPNFPMRNRVIAGLSLGTLVVEAGTSSGALITAACALDWNREVFAVPGSIYAPRSQGTNRLISRGEAKSVSRVEEIMTELNLGLIPQQLAMDGLLAHDHTESKLLDHLGQEPLHIDALIRLTALPVSVVTSTLTMLELRGLVRQVSAMQFVRAR